jgi:replication factor C subunit 1
MDRINFNEILNRRDEENKMIQLLRQFGENKNDMSIKRNIYIYGSSGIGKTTFVLNILNKLNFDVVKYDASDIRNKAVIDNIAHHNMSDKNIMSIFHKKVKQIAIVMDEIDGMNNGDKGGINSLIKIIRPKKTKKQKIEEHTRNPIICIGNYQIDKKIKELMKVCNVLELKPPTITQINTIISIIMPDIDVSLNANLCNFIQNDLKKLSNLYDIYINTPDILRDKLFYNIFQQKSFNDNTKQITNKLFSNKFSIYEHIHLVNDTDRTIIGLLWHENVINHIENEPSIISIPFYLKILKNICFSDYIDRITFQKQIWQFNEMTSLLKTFYNNKLFH